jgi:hypothetical protein
MSWAVATIVCIWIVTVSFDIPMFLWSDLVDNPTGGGMTTCQLIVTNTVHSNIQRVLFYWIPLAVTWCCYARLIYFIRTSMNKVSKQIAVKYVEVLIRWTP